MVSLGATPGRHREWLPERARRDLDAITAEPTTTTTTHAGTTDTGTVNLTTLLDQATEHPLVTVHHHLPDNLPLPARPALAIADASAKPSRTSPATPASPTPGSTHTAPKTPAASR
ncbi:hypothetical protein BJF85_23795 [Saccharomonospora sp. CUA-673]|uniref:hypothetical protein n=1 Tax=Saccharomonospora sp. CUA-673 TaxID=1904969 RepID=UPI0009682550|nr:hypothetical protein [Saccharomonospora sp. CUA-673]OLT41361.1 hypothetical protein BJF85_23795 [Saccharomonospora sp. CUA-673]